MKFSRTSWSDVLERRRALRAAEGYREAPLAIRWRVVGACVPLLALAVVLWQFFAASNVETMAASAGARVLDVAWRVRELRSVEGVDLAKCASVRCWDGLPEARSVEGIRLPETDPLRSRAWPVEAPSLVVYEAHIDAKALSGLREPVLYAPGVRADEIAVVRDDGVVSVGRGHLPLFIALEAARGVDLRIALRVAPTNNYLGFVTRSLFVGDTAQVYRLHHRMANAGFPRQAAVVFLLALGSLTFCFFLFLDRQRDLYALGLSICALGLSEAARTNVLSFLGTRATFMLFSAHIGAFAWYTLELLRLNARVPRLALAIPVVSIGGYFASLALPAATGTAVRVALNVALDVVPAVAAVAALAVAWHVRRSSLWRAAALCASALGSLLHSTHLLSEDVKSDLAARLAESLHDTPVVVSVALWLIGSLATLGSLERRVAQAAADKQRRYELERELELAEEVQRTCVDDGSDGAAAGFEVRTLYRPHTVVGGDWVAWRPLPGGRAFGLVADVCGKGVHAAMVVAACDAALRMKLEDPGLVDATPEELVREVIGALAKAVFRAGAKRTMTAVAMVASPDGQVCCASLGHVPLVIVRGSEAKPLQIMNDWISEELSPEAIDCRVVRLEPGETIAVFSDGVCASYDDLRRICRELGAWSDRPLSEWLAGFERMNRKDDDLAVLIVRRSAGAHAVEPVARPA